MEICRTETRDALNIAARIHSSRIPPVVDIVWIENISNSGARIRSRRSWQPRDQVVLSWLPGDVEVKAKVIYCQRLGLRECAVGLQFDQPVASQAPA